MTTEFWIDVEYPAEHYPEWDSKIEKAAGRSSEGSGMGFGMRDMEFLFHRRHAAEKAMDRIRALKLGHVHVSLRVEEDE